MSNDVSCFTNRYQNNMIENKNLNYDCEVKTLSAKPAN